MSELPFFTGDFNKFFLVRLLGYKGVPKSLYIVLQSNVYFGISMKNLHIFGRAINYYPDSTLNK